MANGIFMHVFIFVFEHTRNMNWMNAFVVVVIAKSRRGRKDSAHTRTHTCTKIDREDDHSGLDRYISNHTNEKPQ